MNGTVPAVVVEGGAAYQDRVPLLVPRGNVVVKVLWARWGGVDEAVRAGLVPAIGPAVAGYTGVGVVVETGIGTDPMLSGRTVALVGVSASYMPPVKGGGFLASYASAPHEYLAPVSRDKRYTLLLDAALACDTIRILVEEGVGSVVVAGAGVYGVLTAYLASLRGLDYYLVTSSPEERRQAARELGLGFSQSTGRADAVVLATLDYSLIDRVARAAEASLLVAHPLIAYMGIRTTFLGRRMRLVGVAGGRSLAGCARELVDSVWNRIAPYTPVVKGLTPPPEKGLPVLGVVYEVSS